MLHPTDATPARRAPRLAASIIPGPPPVMIEKPASPRRRAVSTHAWYAASSGRVRAEPKIETPVPIAPISSKPSTNSPMIRKIRQAS